MRVRLMESSFVIVASFAIFSFMIQVLVVNSLPCRSRWLFLDWCQRTHFCLHVPRNFSLLNLGFYFVAWGLRPGWDLKDCLTLAFFIKFICTYHLVYIAFNRAHLLRSSCLYHFALVITALNIIFILLFKLKSFIPILHTLFYDHVISGSHSLTNIRCSTDDSLYSSVHIRLIKDSIYVTIAPSADNNISKRASWSSIFLIRLVTIIVFTLADIQEH